MSNLIRAADWHRDTWWTVPCKVRAGRPTKQGYRQIRVGGRSERVHRLAFVEAYGPIPPERPHVLHRCDNPPCEEPSHLWAGTHAENMRDRDRKGRTNNGRRDLDRCPAGHPYEPDNLDRWTLEHRGYRNCRTCINERALERARKISVRTA